ARPCTQYYIHRCGAPCVGYVSREQYDEVIAQVILFLEGKHEAVLADLRRQMEEAAENLEFERAASLRDRMQAVEQVLEKQKIIHTTGPGDQDVVALADGDDETCAQVFFFRGGKLVGREYFILQGTRETAQSEIMSSFLQQFYDTAPHIPGELLLATEPDDAEALRQWLRQKRGGAVTLTVPQRGEKLRLVEMVAQNAHEVLEQQRIKWLSDSQKTALALEELREALNLPTTPHRIECYDISNISGTSSVGSMVVLEDGRPRSSDYRRFRIKTVEGSNDVASLQEVLRRRFKRLTNTPTPQEDGSDAAEETEAPLTETETIEETLSDETLSDEAGASADMAGDPWGQLPDLVIVDGGRPQLNAALAVIAELPVGIPVIGIAKENHGTIGTYEEIYLVGQQEPLVLPRGSQGLYLLQRVRDEAHRFAITYHRQVRSKRTFKSVLDDIPGIGPKRKKALIKRFGSARAIAAASLDDLLEVDGMTRDAAERVLEHIGNGRAIASEATNDQD
ncbi:MAG TPA: excinuclease ABC subunit UvrC, partial [Ktedonobacterales bacterium]